MAARTINVKGGDVMRVQGDVFCIRVDLVPKDAKKKAHSSEGIVLARGEATGHAHCIVDDSGVEVYEIDGILYIKTDKPVNVKHEEHRPIVLSPGIWKVGTVREFDAFEQEVRNVRD